MKKSLMALLVLLGMTAVKTQAQTGQWVDMTNIYLTNPSFDTNNRDGWTTSTNAWGTDVRLQAAEFWFSSFFDTYQEVDLPAGNYRLSVRAFYRDNGETNWEGYQNYLDGNWNPYAILYAGDNQQPIVSLYSYATQAYFDNCKTIVQTDDEGLVLDYRYVCNNMESGTYAFGLEGVYENVLEFTHAGGTIRIGVKKDTGVGEDWFMYDNFILEQWVTGAIKVSSIELSPATNILAEGETQAMTATVLPQQAENKSLTWASSNTAVATVTQSGVVTAKSAGTAIITATAKDGSGVQGQAEIIVVEGGKDWSDVTNAYIETTRFDNGTGDWTMGGSGYQVDYGLVESYQQAFDFFQEFDNVPNGRYRMTVQAFYRTGQNSNSRRDNALAGNDPVQAYIYGNDSRQTVANVYSASTTDDGSGHYWTYRTGGGWGGNTGEAYPNDMLGAMVMFNAGNYYNTVEFIVTDGHMRIGITSPSYLYYGWCIFTNFKLEYYGDVIYPTDISVSPASATLTFGEQLQLTATVQPSNATFKKVKWESLDPEIATVDKNGLVTAQTLQGTTEILVTTFDGRYEDVSSITVKSDAADPSQYIVNEVMSGNIEQFMDETYNYGGWIEIYNPTDRAAPLAGYYLSDDDTNLKKWHMPATMGAVPAHGYKVIWFDFNGPKHMTQAPFKLDCDGGTIYLSDTDGKLIVSQDYPEVLSRMSYARETDGGRWWNFTAEPTPGETNNNAEYTDEQLERPYVDKNGQLFTGTLNISVSIPEGATLRYTTDGTLPTLENGETSQTGFFSIDQTTVFRFRLFQDGYLPSEVATRSYIYEDHPYTLPIMSIVTDPKMLYDNTIGCYTAGTNGMRGRGQDQPKNWNQDWERPVNFEYLVDGEDVLNQEVTFNTAGGWSRGWAPASFKLKGNKKFGTSVSNDPEVFHEKTIAYPFFKDKPYIRNRTLQNRNAGNDIENGKPGRMTDAVLQRIALTSGIDIDGQMAEPVLFLINGQPATYDGFGYNYHPSGYINLNMREPNNKHYVYANYGWDDEEIDLWEMDVDSGYVQMCGDRRAFEELYELSASAADPVSYERIRQLLDIEEFQNYMAVYFYLGGTDWPHNNIKSFRNRQDGRFRYVLYDIDWAFRAGSDIFTRFENNYYKKTYGFYPLYDVYDENGRRIDKYYKEVELVAIFCDMLQNDEFRRQFIDRFCIVGGSVYEPTRVEQVINDYAERKKDMLVYDGLPNSMNLANELIGNLRNREQTATSALYNYWRMQLSGVDMQQAELSMNDKAGTIYINDIEVPQDYFKGHLFAPVTLRAEAPAGYRFKGWADLSGNLDGEAVELIPYNSSWQYYDQGSLNDTGWQSENYSDAGWTTGSAPFGFGSSGKPMSYASTILDYGPDSGNKRFTYYMRKEFTLDEEPADGDVFRLDYQVDDGALVWVNGQEAASFHVPSGSTYDYYTNQDGNWYVGDSPATGSFILDSSLLHKGTNYIAVEVHNCNNYSSDLWWDASLTLTKTTDPSQGTIVSTEAEYEMPEGTSINLMALFENMSEEERAEANIAPIRVNEVSASNSVYVNDYYKKDDWVELYNTTNEDIDVEGMYLTDHEDNPLKWQITKGQSNASTIVPANGFLVIWCDKREPLRLVHADFKLAAEGGQVMITARDKSWSDVLRYPPHDGNQTVGRYPNGSDDVYVMTVPTIEKSNIKNSYMTWIDQEKLIPTATDDIYIASNNGLRIFFNGTQLSLRSEDTTSAEVNVYTMTGQRVFRTGVTFQGGAANIGLAPIMPGQTYVARAVDNEGNQCSIKFLYK